MLLVIFIFGIAYCQVPANALSIKPTSITEEFFEKTQLDLLFGVKRIGCYKIQEDRFRQRVKMRGSMDPLTFAARVKRCLNIVDNKNDPELTYFGVSGYGSSCYFDLPTEKPRPDSDDCLFDTMGGETAYYVYKSCKNKQNCEEKISKPVLSPLQMGCPVEKGFCVKENRQDQNSGVIKINSKDGNTLEAQKECLEKCKRHPKATGCEVIWSQGNRGCYIHTNHVDHGNKVGRHMCWVFSKCVTSSVEEINPVPIRPVPERPVPVRPISNPIGSDCPIEKGYCVKENGHDQNSGVIKKNSKDGNTEAAQKECLELCKNHPGATGCEVIWSQGNRGCYIHTQHVDRGNKAGRHMCWVFSKCKINPISIKPVPERPVPVRPLSNAVGTNCPIERGFCVKENGRDQNSGVIKINNKDGNTDVAQEECLERCKNHQGATGCEVIWSQRNRGCYIHTQHVDRGNNRGRHMCWVFSKCS